MLQTFKHHIHGKGQRCPRDQLLLPFSCLPFVIWGADVHEKRETETFFCCCQIVYFMHMETLMEMRQFQFTENGLSVNTLIADERSPLLDGMERRVSSTVSLRCTANSKRESVVLNLSIITFVPLNRWGSVDCVFEAWSTSNHFAAFIIATRTTFWRYFLFLRIVRFPLLFSQDISYHKQS